MVVYYGREITEPKLFKVSNNDTGAYEDSCADVFSTFLAFVLLLLLHQISRFEYQKT